MCQKRPQQKKITPISQELKHALMVLNTMQTEEIVSLLKIFTSGSNTASLPWATAIATALQHRCPGSSPILN